MIRMISGETRIGGITYSAKSRPFEADPAVEKRLVERGAAEYVGKALATDPVDEAETKEAGKGVSTSENEKPAEGQETASGALSEMKATELRDLMQQAGIPYRVGMTKAEMVEALTAADTGAADKPPDLSAAMPE